MPGKNDPNTGKERYRSLVSLSRVDPREDQLKQRVRKRAHGPRRGLEKEVR